VTVPPLPLSPGGRGRVDRGSGRPGEGVAPHPEHAPPPHPNPLPARERESGSAPLDPDALKQRAGAAVSEVCDPEIPVLTIADLGVLRGVEIVDGRVEVTITPTYSGCPAMNTIALEIELALDRAGISGATIRTVLHPAWTTDWMSQDGRRKLRDYGIAPPSPGSGSGRRALFGQDVVACPRCGSEDTERLAEFGSTSCKALWRCRACREPFDYFKCH
jgi:ring-1,2-phenylacetyl-CoA epoxidase subunit PaaD